MNIKKMAFYLTNELANGEKLLVEDVNIILIQEIVEKILMESIGEQSNFLNELFDIIEEQQSLIGLLLESNTKNEITIVLERINKKVIGLKQQLT